MRGLLRCIGVLSACVAAAGAGDLRGRVRDSRGGEPLARVRARLLDTRFETSTGNDGRFELKDVPAGAYVLQIETVGYRLEKYPFSVAENQALEFDVVLSSDTFQRTDNVEVRAGVFDVTPAAGSAPSELSLTGAELKNLGTVLMDDPLRAVHALPGVAATNDFEARFNLRGVRFERIGLYLDDVLLHAPFHAISGSETYGSLSTFNGETMSDVALLPTNPPARYGDRTGGILALRTRDGSTKRTGVRIAAGVAGASILAEGPFAGGRGSWMGSARMSYVQYLVGRISTDSALAIGFNNFQGKVTYALSRSQSVSLYVLDGTTSLDRTAARARSGVNALIEGYTRSTLTRAGWEGLAGNRLLLRATGAWMRERFESTNKFDRPVDTGAYGEWAGSVSATRDFGSHGALDAGWTARRLRSEGAGYQYFNDPNRIQLLDAYRGIATRQGGFVQHNWQLRSGLFRVSAGARWDEHQYYASGVASPQASVALRVPAVGELQLAWGQYVQFPELGLVTSILGGRRLLPERANHLTAALERRIGNDARVRVEAWNRDDRDLIARPLFDPRLSGNGVVLPGDGRLYNSVRSYSRGLQIMVQRRSANRLSGWAGYTWSYARLRDAMERMEYWSPADQRHIANVYLSYRLTASLNLSGRWSYGSGEPIPGYVISRDGSYYLSAERNAQRLSPYQRLDIRANKSFSYDRWKLTLYGEIINLTNHRNMRFVSFDGVNAATRRVSLTVDRVFPIVPVAGVTLEF